MAKIIENLCGVSFDLYRGSKCSFFTPHSSTAQGLYAAASITTAPLAYTFLSAFFALKTLGGIYTALENLVSLNFTQSKNDVIAAGKDAFLAIKAVVFILLSPFINAVNFLGSSINSLRQDSDAKQFELVQP